MINNQNILTIEKYGDSYKNEHLLDYIKKNELIKNDWLEGLKFFFGRAFYQGRRDAISKRVEKNAINILEEYIKQHGREAILNEINFKDIETRLKTVIGKGLVGKGKDVEMTISTLKFISKLKTNKNIVEYSLSKINEGHICEHYNELKREIISVGPKISSFYLRDLIDIYSINTNKFTKEDYYAIQPVDVWVKRCSLELGIINKNKEKDDLIRKKIVDACYTAGASPIKFNQGAWYLGANSFEILLKTLKISKTL